MIASRYFVLPNPGGLPKSFFNHQRLWQRCTNYFLKMHVGENLRPASPMSVLGYIESCLLISDWPPRFARFGLELDEEDKPEGFTGGEDDSDLEPHMVRWQEDVIEPSKRSDHMSWMWLGSATTLAFKMGLFLAESQLEKVSTHEAARRDRARRLLYAYTTNISIRLGSVCPLTPSIRSMIPTPSRGPQSDLERGDQTSFMDLWCDLLRLMKTASAMFFESMPTNQHQFIDGKYVVLLEHFGPALQRWHDEFVKKSPCMTQFCPPSSSLLLTLFQISRPLCDDSSSSSSRICACIPTHYRYKRSLKDPCAMRLRTLTHIHRLSGTQCSSKLTAHLSRK